MKELLDWLKTNQLEKYQEVLVENDINTLELLAIVSAEIMVLITYEKI